MVLERQQFATEAVPRKPVRECCNARAGGIVYAELWEGHVRDTGQYGNDHAQECYEATEEGGTLCATVKECLRPSELRLIHAHVSPIALGGWMSGKTTDLRPGTPVS